MAKTVRMLTDRFVRNYTFRGQPGARDEIWDEGQHGLILRCTEKNKRTFVLYAKFAKGGPSSRREIGNADDLPLADARAKVREWRTLIAQGTDPREHEEKLVREHQERRANTVELVAGEWFRSIAGQRKAAEVERDVRRVFVAEWGKRPITEITKRHVRDVIIAVKDQGKAAQAHNLLGYGRRMFDWAVEQEVFGLSSSPFERFKPRKLIGPKIVRQRVLADAELRALWRAAGGAGYPFGSFVQMLALTGQRKSEVCEARWSEIDLASKVWIIPEQRMKSGNAHAVPICDDLHALLSSLPRFGGDDDFLFTQSPAPEPPVRVGARGRPLAPRIPHPRQKLAPAPGTVAINGHSKAKNRLDAAMARELGKPLDHFTLHDIRRTFRTGLSALQVPDRVCEAVIAHAQPMLHRVYDRHRYDQEKREALSRWELRLRSIIDPPKSTDNVVQFGRTV